MRPLLFGRLFKKALIRSRIWSSDSDRQLRIAVAGHNTKVGWEQAIFIPSVLTEENAVETPNTLLFRMHKNGTVEDPLFSKRKADCKAAFDELKSVTGIQNSPKRCTVAAIGHPNPAIHVFQNILISFFEVCFGGYEQKIVGECIDANKQLP